jgi:hypothetical protein
MHNEKQIKAFYNENYVRIYQAYNDTIAANAIKNNKFLSPPFNPDRTTWIKPSFLWMMYRSGWATKQNQERILAIDITHDGFQWAIKNSVSSHFDADTYKCHSDWLIAKKMMPVVIQWDPERDIFLNKLTNRTIQIGLKSSAAKLYIDKWIIKITDYTAFAIKIKSLIVENKIAEAASLLPLERNYHVLT